MRVLDSIKEAITNKFSPGTYRGAELYDFLIDLIQPKVDIEDVITEVIIRLNNDGFLEFDWGLFNPSKFTMK